MTVNPRDPSDPSDPNDPCQPGAVPCRRIFMVISPRSLGYARYALESLLRNCLEPIHLHLITDSIADKALLVEEMTSHQNAGRHAWSVFAEEDFQQQEAAIFAHHPGIRQLRKGHPCWRKITDPVLLSRSGEEMVLLDPDLYFPNRFRFEETLDQGLLLMWQRPNCLLPAEVVNAALQAGIPLARHVDIGVAHWRAPVDLDWLEWLLGKLGGPNLPRVMHVEAILWAALAMRMGGGYLAPDLWHCWRRSQPKRVLRKLGVPGVRLLRFEHFSRMKCFHAGGEAKYWLADAQQRGDLEGENGLSGPGPVLPFVELTPDRYRREQRMKGWLKKWGYYDVFQSA